MLRSRLIPVLVLSGGALVKTVNFKSDIYLGDPLNAVRTFNEMCVDEIIILDIDASKTKVEPNYRLLERVAAECQIPLCYGGGITDPSQVERLVGLGIEKVSINSSSLSDPTLLLNSAQIVGAQSVILSIDLKKRGFLAPRLAIYRHVSADFSPISISNHLSSFEPGSYGEVLLQFVDCDGTLSGYDIANIESILPLISTPVTIAGGASSLDDVALISSKFGPLGCAASSIFLLKGPLRAPLIQYPDYADKLSALL